MAVSEKVSVRFWGVRGSIPTPGPTTLRYGGNTACIEVRCGEQLIILDAGTGIRLLGDQLKASGMPIDADLLCTHTHIDHICGYPFFAPGCGPDTKLRLWAGHLSNGHNLRDVFRLLLSPPLFPALMDEMAAGIDYCDFSTGETLPLRSGVVVKTGRLNHPGGATGYRIESAGRSVAYITDTEHPAKGFDANVLTLVDHADLMIYDANYTDEEYPRRIGWGHSTWQAAVAIADAAAVKTLVLYHHDYNRTDDMLDAIGDAASRLRPGTLVAREGMELTL